MSLIALAKIGKLQILIGKITIPKAVWHEVVVKGKGKQGAEEVEKAEWIEVKEVRNKLSVEILKGR